MSKRIAVLCSGGGTNLQALIDAVEAGSIDGEIVLVLANASKAFALERARRHGIPAEFISKILSKITLIGAIFLAFVAILPILYSNLTGMYGLSMGGTSVIIMVGVALETVKQIESQMMMRHYKGFLD